MDYLYDSEVRRHTSVFTTDRAEIS